ncbi:MAG: cyclase family protein [Armatimonadota bacterium]
MIYDVTLPIAPDMVVWPGDPPIECETFGETVRISRWTLGSHTGTHVDAPTHFSAGEQTVDQLDPAVLLGPCRVIHLPDVPVITGALLAGLPLQDTPRLLFRTRNSTRWAANPTTFIEDYVGLDITAARVLLDAGVKLVGIDSLSIGAPDDCGFVHELLLSAGIIILEGLQLANIAAGPYHLICAPLKLAASDGAPARVFLVE